MLAAALHLAAALALAAATAHGSFRYEVVRSLRRSDESCRVCLGDECARMSEARCQYYALADDVLDRDDAAGDMSLIDQLVGDMTQQALMSWTVNKCVPFISYYTDCNKENVCVGCKTCTCSEAGAWTCSQQQHCRPADPVKMDHHTLISVIQNLNELDNSIRRKRLANKISEKSEIKEIGLMDIAEWLHESKPKTDSELSTPREAKLNYTENSTANTEPSTKFSTSSYTTEIETLGFDEVLKNIAIENHKRRKSELGDSNDTANFYTNFDQHMDNKNCTEPFLNVLNDIEEGIDVTEPTDATTFVVDLFPLGNKATDSAETNKEILNIIYKEENGTVDKLNDEVESNLINRKKRDTKAVTVMENSTQDDSLITTATETSANKQNDLKKNVLLPLTNIINDKQNEIKDLLQIKENLLHVMEIHYNDTELNITKVPEKTNGSTFFSVFKLDLYPEIHENLRRNHINILEKLLYKLKRDIYEVLRDVARIQKISSTRGLPDDLKMLIRSMKYYVNKQGSIRNFKKKDIQLGSIYNDTRRSQASDESTTPKSIKRQLVDILEILDKETLHSEASVNLSTYPQKILKRVVRQNFVDEYSAVGFKLSNDDYNMTTDLRTIGKDWPHLMEYVTNSPPHEKIYAMKLLHFTLSSDVTRITNAIALMDFAHSRRMSPIEVPLAGELLENINTGLASIKHKLKILIQYQMAQQKDILKKNVIEFRTPNKKQSFLKRLKDILKKSRKEILSMAKKQTPKSDDSKYLAKKKHEKLSNMKMSKDKETMLRWQTHFNIQQRKKRDLTSYVSNMKNRMKNIIPKYLRGKVNPAIQKHKKKPKSAAKKTRKQKNRHSSEVRTIIKTSSQIPTKKSNKSV